MAESPMFEKRNLSAFMQQLRLAARRSAFSCSSRVFSSSDIIASAAMLTAVTLGVRSPYSGGSDASDGLLCRAIVTGLSVTASCWLSLCFCLFLCCDCRVVAVIVRLLL